MALSVSRRFFRAFGSCDYSSLRSFYISNDTLSSLQSSVPGKSSFDIWKKYFTSILTPESSESAFPSDLLSRKRVFNSSSSEYRSL